jgi:hypothetical protein
MMLLKTVALISRKRLELIDAPRLFNHFFFKVLKPQQINSARAR